MADAKILMSSQSSQSNSHPLRRGFATGKSPEPSLSGSPRRRCAGEPFHNSRLWIRAVEISITALIDKNKTRWQCRRRWSAIRVIPDQWLAE